MTTITLTPENLTALLTRVVVDLTTAIGEGLEEDARMDERMNDDVGSAMRNVAHTIQHGIDPEWIAKNAVAKFVEEDL